MIAFQHYELAKKWAGAGALVFGRKVRAKESDLPDSYHGWYENDTLEFFPAVWPLGEAEHGVVPAVVGSGDLYHALADGQDRNGGFLTYQLEELRREQAGLGDYFDYPDSSIEVDDAESRWWLVKGRTKQSVAVYYGVAIKPGAVPSTLPSGLEAFRAQGESGKAHPRTIVGVRLADTSGANIVPFDPGDPRVAAAKRALTAALPKNKNRGFVVVPCDGNASKVAAPTLSTASAPVTSPQAAPEEAAFLARLTERFGPLESDGDRYFSGSMRGVVMRVATSDLFAAWYAAPDFAFGDRAARYRMWRGDGVTLAEVEIDTIDGDLTSRWLGLVELGDQGLLSILEHCDEATAKELLGIAADAPAEHGETTLGNG